MIYARQQLALSAVTVFVAAHVAAAGSHLWRFNEVFSNEDGTVQFIELHESMGATNETQLQNKWVASDTTGEQYVFPQNLVPPTSDRYLLLATAAFADLPGAPTPDFIIPDNFLSLDADTLRYWTYPAATMSWAAGAVPTDGVLSLNIDGSTGTNSPTNYGGDSGSVAAGNSVPAASTWGLAVLTLLLLVVGTTVLGRRAIRGASRVLD